MYVVYIGNICVKFHQETMIKSKGYLVILKGFEFNIIINYFIHFFIHNLKINHNQNQSIKASQHPAITFLRKEFFKKGIVLYYVFGIILGKKSYFSHSKTEF